MGLALGRSLTPDIAKLQAALLIIAHPSMSGSGSGVDRATLRKSRRIDMSTRSARPSSIEGIKRLAKKIASEKSVKHTTALNEAAVLAGYQNFIHAKHALSPPRTAPRSISHASATRSQSPMSQSDFHIRSRAEWTSMVNHITSNGDATLSWQRVDDIVTTLQPFMGSNKNHAHLPRSGGFDFLSVAKGREPGCIEFGIFSGTTVVVKPRRLVLERIASDPAESFLMLELDDLEPSGTTREDCERSTARRQEEVVEVGRGEYAGRSVYDDGYFLDDRGNERELPDDARPVLRLLNGQIMFVTKGSIWNGSSSTYSGIHDSQTTAQIRDAIQQIIDDLAAA
ncbi:hypothetical protein [Aminobacter ciceronei]|uniref:Uncharacterized protein n=1 Tax=Aminobacter ciceronei TaxID=150723 RepID=A0ABR6C9J0_9HYPH|nr:hypothetical protein [Aminobacter ciceronei]MBA8907928.1 hypothetical protein [Aminobacter ciceronei]MBA9021683.1 hypothetical protein [Aminobacter ciceronei]